MSPTQATPLCTGVVTALFSWTETRTGLDSESLARSELLRVWVAENRSVCLPWGRLATMLLMAVEKVKAPVSLVQDQQLEVVHREGRILVKMLEESARGADENVTS